MKGPYCPIHAMPMDWLSTSNEWEYYCPLCDRRYNQTLEPKPEEPEIVEMETLYSKDVME